jgi:transposase InsO family protein
MSRRVEFVQLATAEGAEMAALCRRFGISRKTGYKWLKRYAETGARGLSDQSRRPQSSPAQTPATVEEVVVELRREHPAWGGRKLRGRLLAKQEALGLQAEAIPAASTITEILRRRGLLTGERAGQSRAYVRFEHAAPNDLWQMDFKGHFALTRGGRCHPLTVLDDHSRFALALRACGDETTETVQGHLQDAFRTYGVPERMLMDNGSPWGDAEGQPYTRLTVWLLRVGIGVTHCRAGHPQTQGKDERFHRTLNVEVLRGRSFADVANCQGAFDPWRDVYNLERPHEALGLAVPASRYRVSGREYPESLPPVEYGSDVQVRRTSGKGMASFLGRRVHVGRAFAGEPVGFRPTAEDGVWEVRYGHHRIGRWNVAATARGEWVSLAVLRCEEE